MNTRYTIDKKGFFGQTAVILLLLSAVLRGVAAALSRTMLKGDLFATVEFLLPAVVCVFYVLAIILFGKKGFFLSVLPFIAGILGFIMRLFSYDNLSQEIFPLRHTFLSVLIYLVLLTAYAVTVTGGIRTKWLLPPLFLLMPVYHALMEVYPVIASHAHVEASQIIAEVSIFSLLLGLIAVSFGLSGEKGKEKPAISTAGGNKPAEQPAGEDSKAAPEVKEEPVVVVVEDIPELAEEEPETDTPVQTDVPAQTDVKETAGPAEE